MKINPGEVKRGTILQIEGKLFRITDISHTHMARGGATYTFKAKDVITGKTNTFTYQSTVTLEQAEVQTINSVFLYKAGTSYSFMENDSGEMHDLKKIWLKISHYISKTDLMSSWWSTKEMWSILSFHKRSPIQSNLQFLESKEIDHLLVKNLQLLKLVSKSKSLSTKKLDKLLSLIRSLVKQVNLYLSSI